MQLRGVSTTPDGGDAMTTETYDPLISPYEVSENEFPSWGTLEEQFAFLLRYAILAPSTHNTQPWKFSLSPDGIQVFGDYTRRMPVVDPGNRELLMSIGAAIATLRLAAARFRFSCSVTYNLSGDSERPLAFASLAPLPPSVQLDEKTISLFGAITHRHTNRHPFLLARVPESLARELQDLRVGDSAAVFVSTDAAMNQRVGLLVEEAERMQLSDPAFRTDLAEWVRPNWTQKGDGITGAALGVNSVAAAVGPWVTRALDLGGFRGARDRNFCIEAPALVVLQSEDTVPQLLEAGELLQTVLLTATNSGLHHSYFNMPMQVNDLRIRLRAILGISAWPQVLLRIGFSFTQPAKSPRRPLEEVLVSPSTE
jgi:hypothetical protein